MASTIDQQFVEFVAKSVVSKPEKVEVKRTIDEKGVLLELTVDPEDLGRVIGKRGATAQSFRTLLRALGTKNDARYNLKIVDNGAPRPAYSPAPSTDSSDDAATPPAAAADDSSADKPEAVVETEDIAAEDEEQESDTVSKARKELADLDDLDI